MERIIGRDRDGEILAMLGELAAKPGTAYLPHGFSNPAPDELDRLAKVTNRMAPCDARAAARHLSRWIPGAGLPDLPDAIHAALGPAREAAPGTVYTIYAKLMCWLAGPLRNAVAKDAADPAVLVSGPLSKHGLLAMEALEAAGARVLYFDPVSDAGYRKADPGGERSRLSEYPVREPLDGPLEPPAPGRGAWMAGRAPWDAARIPAGDRPAGAAVLAYVAGTGDRAAYRNMLYDLKKDLEAGGRPVTLVLSHQSPPGNGEIDRFRIDFKDAYKGMPAVADAIAAKAGDPALESALRRALRLVPAPDVRKGYNRAIRTACWAKRLASAAPGAVIGYGPFEPKESEAWLALSLCGTDVIWFDPEASCPNPAQLEAEGWTVPEAMAPGAPEPFPEAPERVRAETVAHAASRELDGLLYRDSGIYRDRQFKRAGSVTLRTTFDEVLQLWREPPNVRPGFRSDGETATVPCLFSKVAGVPNADERTYWNQIRNMTGKDVLLVDRLPFLKDPGSLPPAPRRGCSPEEFDEAAGRPHDYLPDATRNMVLGAAAVLCGPSTTLKEPSSGEDRSMVLHAVRNMPKQVLDLVQAFDPAKSTTKVLVVQTGTRVLSRYECVMLALLNVVGLDVAVFTPPGYRDLEKYLKEDAFDLIQAGPYVPDIQVPNLKKRGGILSGLLDGLLD